MPRLAFSVAFGGVVIDADPIVIEEGSYRPLQPFHVIAGLNDRADDRRDVFLGPLSPNPGPL